MGMKCPQSITWSVICMQLSSRPMPVLKGVHEHTHKKKGVQTVASVCTVQAGVFLFKHDPYIMHEKTLREFLNGSRVAQPADWKHD